MAKIKIIGCCLEPDHPFVGKYVKLYDPADEPVSDPYDGGVLELTTDPAEAFVYADIRAAFNAWRAVAPAPYSIRADGKLNRPLTAFDVEVLL